MKKLALLAVLLFASQAQTPEKDPFAALEAEATAILTRDVAAINAMAAKLGLPFITR